MVDRIGTAWDELRKRSGEWAAQVAERMDRIAPWVVLAVDGAEIHAVLSGGKRIAYVSIEKPASFICWAHDELSRLEAVGVGADRNVREQAVDCCARYVLHKILEACNPDVGGMAFTSWPPEDWPAYQAGFIAGHHTKGQP